MLCLFWALLWPVSDHGSELVAVDDDLEYALDSSFGGDVDREAQKSFRFHGVT